MSDWTDAYPNFREVFYDCQRKAMSEPISEERIVQLEQFIGTGAVSRVSRGIIQDLLAEIRRLRAENREQRNDMETISEHLRLIYEAAKPPEPYLSSCAKTVELIQLGKAVEEMSLAAQLRRLEFPSEKD